ncbi:MAG TPA: GAF domain-containing protein, partial [Streptosporangiaceae bacterium]|nr:GAF domain-containing protein [Streptosporangiaceae bacterium]
MTEAAASSRVTQENGTRRSNGSRGGEAANGAPRYSQADLEPIRARLAAFARGNFRPRGEPADDGYPADPVLAEIIDLADEVGSQLASVTSEVAQSEAQVRDIALITTAVARGDLTGKVTVEATGEMLQLKLTVNMLVDQLSAFADEVTRVAREVGSEGRLGGQAKVEGVSGTWKRLTASVNELASNLTTQVRAIAEVASAVALGDMSGSISVEAEGEVAALKDNINLMVANLRETTRAKDWLESNLARFAGLMQGHGDLMEVADLILRELTPLVSAQYGAFFLAEPGAGRSNAVAGTGGISLARIAGYGAGTAPGGPSGGSPEFGHGLAVQAAVEKKRLHVVEAPPDYIKIGSGLGEARPASIVILPILFEDHVLGVI